MLGTGVLIALGAAIIGRILLSIPVYFIFFLLLLFGLRTWRMRVKNNSKQGLTNTKLLLFSLILSIVAALAFPLPRLSDLKYKSQVAKYRSGTVPTTYPYATVSNVTSNITSDDAVITFDLTVAKGGDYSIKGEIPCYKKTSPPTQEEKYGTPQSSQVNLKDGQPYKLTFSYVLDEKYKNNRSCKKFFEFRLSPIKANLLGEDNFVTFTGYLERIKAAGADSENAHTPYIYISEFNFTLDK